MWGGISSRKRRKEKEEHTKALESELLVATAAFHQQSLLSFPLLFHVLLLHFL